MAIDFINKFQSPVKTMVCCEWESSTLNGNYTRDEVEAAIDYLKCPQVSMIFPPNLLKHVKKY